MNFEKLIALMEKYHLPVRVEDGWTLYSGTGTRTMFATKHSDDTLQRLWPKFNCYVSDRWTTSCDTVPPSKLKNDDYIENRIRILANKVYKFTNGAEGVAPVRKVKTKKVVQKNESVFDCLSVTDVQVFPFKVEPSLGNIKGVAAVVLNDQFVVRGVRIMDSNNGLFVTFPLDPFYKGEDFRCIAQPITRQLREHIEKCVLEKYIAETDN